MREIWDLTNKDLKKYNLNSYLLLNTFIILLLDAGVVCGLSYGTISICVLTIKALLVGSIHTDDNNTDDNIVEGKSKTK